MSIVPRVVRNVAYGYHAHYDGVKGIAFQDTTGTCWFVSNKEPDIFLALGVNDKPSLSYYRLISLKDHARLRVAMASGCDLLSSYAA